ncbi:MAG: hypothetical protein RL695_2458 [Pseudomonadota bacterium]
MARGRRICLAGLLAISLAATAQPVPPVTAAARPATMPTTLATPSVIAPQAAARPADDANVIRVLLSPDVETTLVSQMVGRISSLQAQLGQRVVKGSALVRFDCSELSARFQMAQAEFASANETQEVKERLRKLDAAGDVEVLLARAGADKARAAIAVSRAQMAQCAVLAPFTGRVVKVHVKPHQGVNVGAPLVDLISEGPLKLRLNVPSRWLRQLKEGLPFEVTITETGRTYPAQVTLINARVDAVAQTVELEARMKNAEPDLLAGMSGVAQFRLHP